MKSDRSDDLGLKVHFEPEEWKHTFERLTGWPPEPISEEELREEMVRDIRSAIVSRQTLKGAVDLEEAIEDGILQRGPNEGMVELSVVEGEVIQIDKSERKTTTNSSIPLYEIIDSIKQERVQAVSYTVE